MGSIIRYTHKKCGFELETFQGRGFSLFAQQCDARKHMRDGDWGEHWKEMMEKYPEGTATLGKKLFFCENCKKYFTENCVVFWIPKEGYHYEPEEDDDDDRVPGYVLFEHYDVIDREVIECPDCHAPTPPVKNPNKIPCPVCGEMRRGRDIGCWD